MEVLNNEVATIIEPPKMRVVEELQNLVYKNRLTLKELEERCEKEGLDAYEDVLFPMDYNTCDRCGAIVDSEYDAIYIDYLDSDNANDRAVLDSMEEDYCEICDDCYAELKRKGAAGK